MIGVGTTKRKALVLAEALVRPLEQIPIDDGGPGDDDPFVSGSSRHRRLALTTIDPRLGWLVGLHSHHAVQAKLSSIGATREYAVDGPHWPASSTLRCRDAPLTQTARDAENAQPFVCNPAENLAD
jgi:hypothetical protein